MGSLYYLVHLSVLLYQLQSKERQRFNLCRRCSAECFTSLNCNCFHTIAVGCFCINMCVCVCAHVHVCETDGQGWRWMTCKLFFFFFSLLHIAQICLCPKTNSRKTGGGNLLRSVSEKNSREFQVLLQYQRFRVKNIEHCCRLNVFSQDSYVET